jgi:hypothetical protein|tara:strand:+ start:4156 stop:4326 length:171 start_codon:yes stop_codon:yes gene_type:complete
MTISAIHLYFQYLRAFAVKEGTFELSSLTAINSAAFETITKERWKMKQQFWRRSLL